MWNSLNKLAENAKENAKAVAQKAKAVAADLEGQLDKSVGVDGGQKAAADETLETDFNMDDDENAWNDDFPMDDEDDEDDGDDENIAEDAVAQDRSLLVGHEQSVDAQNEAKIAKDAEMAAPPSASPVDTIKDEGLSETFDASPTLENTAVESATTAATTATLDETVPDTDTQQLPEQEILSTETTEAQEVVGKAESAANEGTPDFIAEEKDDTDAADSNRVVTKEVQPLAAYEPNNNSDGGAQPTESVFEADASSTTDMMETSPMDPGVSSATEYTTVPQVWAAEASNEGASPDMPPTETAVEGADSHNNHAIHREATSDASNEKLLAQIAQLQEQLQQREQQLAGKAEQISNLYSIHENEKMELEKRLEHTKEEAKKRLAGAKARVEAAERKASAASSSSSDTAAQKEEIISALREEGQKLAHKQSEMERAVRTAKGEARELREQLESEETAKTNALQKIVKLEADLKNTKADLSAARRGESQASKLETDLQSAREDAERKAATILALEQQVKELKASSKELVKELEAAQKGAVIESEREQKKLKKEHTSMLDDLENKLRTTEKEAAVREDALRHEVTELRKRWQDAVRRADSLSMDVQSSTAPLMRQLESMERQGRTRAAGWAELETKLRQDLEDSIVENEKLQKDRNEVQVKYQRLERKHTEIESDFAQAKSSLEEKTERIKELETEISKMEKSHAEQKQEWDEVHRLANDGVAKVRSEMTQTVVEAEERHSSLLDSLKSELRQERDKRQQLEQQVQDLLDKATAMVLPPSNGDSSSTALPKKAPPKKLSSGQGQVEILSGALGNLGGDESDNENETTDNTDRDDDDDDDNVMGAMNGGGSFAALEELQSRLRVAKVELNTLRKSLTDSEKTREKLVTELGECRFAKEKLPLFEKKVEELTTENNQMTLEIEGLQEDIAEVRELYRAQLNILLEEKASSAIPPSTEKETLPNGSLDQDVLDEPDDNNN